MLRRFATLTLTLSLALPLAACSGRDREVVVAPPLSIEASGNRPDHVIGGNVIPQSHAVPPGRGAAIRALFESGAMSYPIAVVSAQGAQTQFVNPRPVFIGEQRFVVGAPPNVHQAIDQLIQGMDKAPARQSSTYEVTYWLVEAIDAPKSEVPPDLAEVAPMLEGLAGLGTRRYKSLDRVATRTREGADAKLAGRMMRVDQELASGPEGLELEVRLGLTGTWSDKPEAGPSIETELHLPLDKPIVIGDSAQAAGSGGAANLLLYVVRARRVD